jgi:hypothetical protein
MSVNVAGILLLCNCNDNFCSFSDASSPPCVTYHLFFINRLSAAPSRFTIHCAYPEITLSITMSGAFLRISYVIST